MSTSITPDNPNNSNQLNKKPEPNSALPVTPFVFYFGIGFVLASVVFMWFQSTLRLDALVVLAISVLFAAFVATFKFIRKHKRAMTSNELNMLSLLGTLLVWSLSLIYFMVIVVLLLDDISREVLLEMSREKPMSLSLSFFVMLSLTAICARVGLEAFNRLLSLKLTKK